jgi:hypothetical protein
MLVLSLLRGDLVFVAGPCLLHLVDDGHRPRIGFLASAEVPILRGNVLIDMIKQELGAQRPAGEDDLTNEERCALEVAYLVLSDEEVHPDTAFSALNNEPMQELLLGFHRDATLHKAA